MSSTQGKWKDTTPKGFVSRGKSKSRVTPFVESVPLFSVDQIREEASPWKALADLSKNKLLKGKSSAFKKRLQECKKLRMLYGNLPQRVLNRYLRESYRPEDLLLLLESRLDITLKRSALFPSIQSARRSILEGGILVNHAIVHSPRYHCTPGDLIQVAQRNVLGPSTQRGNRHKAISQGLSSGMCNVFMRPKIKPRKERTPKTCSINQGDCLPYPCSFLELWFLSELLHSWGRRAGRLHTSMFFHSKKIEKESSLESTLERRINPPVTNTFDRISFTHLATRISFEGYYKQLSIESSKDTSFNDKTSERQNTSSDLNQPIGDRNVRVEQSLPQTISSRPLHLEVSYRDLCVIFLYRPQRICVDVSIDLSLIC